MTPKVSIILTTHGEGKYLKQAIGSVLAQTFEDWELLVSCDGLIASLNNMYFRDKRFQMLTVEIPDNVNCRFAYTINKAFKESKGEFITYLCHDDLYLPYRLDVMVRVMEELKLDVVFGNQQLIDESGGHWWGHVRTGSIENPLATVDHSSVMHRRECFEKVGGWDESSPMRFGDAYFWRRLVAAGYKFNGIDQVLDVHRFNKDSVSWKEDHATAFEKVTA